MGTRTKVPAVEADRPARVEQELVRVERARHVRDFVVELRFTDGSIREINLEPYLRGPVFAAVKDPEYFRKFRIDRKFGTICWPNGADIDPDVLFLGLRPAGWDELPSEPMLANPNAGRPRTRRRRQG